MEGRVMEAFSRVMAALDRLERRLDELRRSVEALASTVYLSCLSEKLGGFEGAVRRGLPPGVAAVARGADGNVYVIGTATVCGWEDAARLARLAGHVAAIAGLEPSPGGGVVAVMACSRYEGGDPPEGVRVILC